ncbi:centrosome-associated protein CEP250 isoform X5 [Dermacentor silvarum]|uniref:centrosome-associated protein CEP250 isoform X5 n=1 Tax=Dermacentor silvarum TaxID=543639 RepID=UPI00210167BC|nr:centrosome-associated protein CEP250 isoform X5 [Dermacentor silvarum]
MSLGPGQRRPAPTARVMGFNLTPEKSREHSDGGEPAAVSGKHGLRQAIEEVRAMERDIKSKEMELTDCKEALKAKASRVYSLARELMEVKNSMKEMEQRCKANERRVAELELAVEDATVSYQDLLKKLTEYHKRKDELMENMRLLEDCNNNIPNLLNDCKKDVKQALSEIKTVKSRMRDLTLELDICRKELDAKSQLYEDSVETKISLEEQLGDLQKHVEALTADNAKCQSKMQFLVEEHSNVLSERASLECQLKEEKDERALLDACLRKLAESLCAQLDLNNMSTLAVIEATGNALQQLIHECGSLRDKEALNDSTITALTAEKDALAAEKQALGEKLKDLHELQENNQRLEEELKVQANVKKEMIKDFRESQHKLLDYFEQLERETATTLSTLDKRSYDLLAGALGGRSDISNAMFRLRHISNRVSELDNECVQKEMELQRLNGVCANNASTIEVLKAENERLYDGVNNFEQLAQGNADDLAEAQREIASLKEALAAAEMEAVPVEEREKAALLLLEKETQVSQLEEKLKEMEGALSELRKEKEAAYHAAEVLSDANQGLKDAMLNLAEELTQERSQKENRVDTNMQTEYATKVDCDLQTDDIPEVNLNLQPKVDCEVQTANTSDDEFLSKLAGAHLEINRLNLSLRRLNFEKEALQESHKDCEGTRAEEEHTRLDLERRVEQLLDQAIAKEREMDEQQKTINSLQASLELQEKEAQKLSRSTNQASAELKTQNERLKAEVSKVQKKVQDLICELNTVKETEALKRERIEQLYKQTKEEVQFLKKSCDGAPGTPLLRAMTPVFQSKFGSVLTAAAAEPAVEHEHAGKCETIFTPEPMDTPVKSSVSWTGAKATVLAAPFSVAESPSTDHSSGDSAMTPVFQSKFGSVLTAAATEPAVEHEHAGKCETMFTPKPMDTPVKSSVSWTGAKATVLAAPFSVAESPSTDHSSGDSLSNLMDEIERTTSKASLLKQSGTGVGTHKEESASKLPEAAKMSARRAVAKPVTTTRRKSPRQAVSEKSRRCKATVKASPYKASTVAGTQKRSVKPSKKADDTSLVSWPEMSTKSAAAAPAAKKRKFFQAKDSDSDDFFSMGFV